MMTATPNDVRFANDVCLAAHFMANIASLRNEVEQHHICEANASYRRRRCFIVIRGQIRTATLEMFTNLCEGRMDPRALFLLLEFFLLLLAEASELVVGSQFLQKQLHSLVQFASLGIVCLKYPVHTLVVQ